MEKLMNNGMVNRKGHGNNQLLKMNAQGSVVLNDQLTKLLINYVINLIT